LQAKGELDNAQGMSVWIAQPGFSRVYLYWP
jgi:hypothetical protein